SLGMPALCASSTSLIVVNGVFTAGLHIIVQPAANAGAILRVIIAAGKFQGVIAPTTPTGNLSITIFLDGVLAGIVRPYTLFASSAYHLDRKSTRLNSSHV